MLEEESCSILDFLRSRKSMMCRRWCRSLVFSFLFSLSLPLTYTLFCHPHRASSPASLCHQAHRLERSCSMFQCCAKFDIEKRFLFLPIFNFYFTSPSQSLLFFFLLLHFNNFFFFLKHCGTSKRKLCLTLCFSSLSSQKKKQFSLSCPFSQIDCLPQTWRYFDFILPYFTL